MKFLKYLFFLLLIILVAGFLYVTMQSSSYDVKRSKVMKVPISNVFNTVNNYKTWGTWGPWMEQDTTIVLQFSDTSIGKGAHYSWTSNSGPGSMKTTEVIQNKFIAQKMQFGDFDPSDVYWSFEEVNDGTKVTWGIKETNAPFMFKFFAAISGGWDKMLGPMEEKGLENLEKVVMKDVKEANSFKIDTPTIIKLATQKFIGYYHKSSTDMKEFSKLFVNDMPKATMYAMKNGLKHGDFTPGAVYIKWDEEKGETEFYIGLLLYKDLKPAKGMTTLNLPKGGAVKMTKWGNYGVGDYQAHMVIEKYMKENKQTMMFPIWELYVNDPSQVKPQEIQTDIYYPIKK